MIPKIIHHIWTTDKNSNHSDFPNLWERKYARFRESFMLYNPDWSFMFWNDSNWPDNMNPGMLEMVTNPDINFIVKSPVRWEILRLFGGVYVDCDVECMKPLECFLADGSFAGIESPDGNIGNAIVGCEPGNQAVEGLTLIELNIIRKHYDLCVSRTVRALGPRSTHEQAALRSFNKIYPREIFYPFDCVELEKRNDYFPEAYAKHHWSGCDIDGWKTINNGKSK